jgi:hypothetical protein
MKKTIFALGLMAALVAKADYLYWMVDDAASSDYNWTSATIYQDTSPLASATSDDFDVIGYSTASLNPGYDVATYYIELYNGSTPVAKASLGYNDIKNNIFTDNSMGIPTRMPFVAPAGSFQAVPEPTSGLLFLVGGMLLGLRRKRRV